MTNSKITRAVRDQNKSSHFLFKGPDGSVWLSSTDFHTEAGNGVWERLSRIGIECLTTSKKNAVKKMIEAHSSFDECLVADRPGWLDDSTFALQDGSVIYGEKKHSKRRSVLVVFEPDTRFKKKGKLKVWRKETGRVIGSCEALQFIMAYSYVGPLLRFAAPHLINPSIEIVAPAESGKSIIGVAAASIYAGSTESAVGGGDTWNTTANALEKLRDCRRDTLLYLDEQNEQAQDLKASSSAIFANASGSKKARLNQATDHRTTSAAVLSTSNTAKNERIQDHKANERAADTRQVSLIFHGPLMTNTPVGFKDTASAMNYLRATCSQNWGLAGRKWIELLAQLNWTNSSKLKCIVTKAFENFERRTSDLEFGSHRIREMFALTYCAAGLAQRYGVFPKINGHATAGVIATARKYCSRRDQQIDQITTNKFTGLLKIASINIMEVHDVKNKKGDLSTEDCWMMKETMASQTRFYTTDAALERLCGESAKVAAKSLKRLGLLSLADSESHRHKRKVPAALKGVFKGDRAYCIALSRSNSK